MSSEDINLNIPIKGGVYWHNGAKWCWEIIFTQIFYWGV